MQTQAARFGHTHQTVTRFKSTPVRAASEESNDRVALCAPPAAGPAPIPTSQASSGPSRAQLEAEKASSPVGLPLWMRGVCGVLVGAIGLVALTGCNRGGGTPEVSVPADTVAHPEAEKKLGDAFKEIEASMGKSGQNSEQESAGVTRRVIDAVKNYSRETGKSAKGVAADVKEFMVEHPALTVTVMFAVGTAAGVGLEKLGFTEAVGEGLHSVKEWASEHKIAAGLIVTAAAAGTAYLIYQIAQTEGEVPQKPTNAEAKELEKTFVDLEKQLQESQNPEAQAAQVNRTLMQKIKDYAQKTGRSAKEVANDVKAYAYEHPMVAAAIVIGAGVATGVILEHAGVPDKVAGLIGSALESGKDGVKSVGRFVKEHPVISGAIAVGIAAGVGYLVYDYMTPDQAPAPQPGPASGQTQQKQATTSG